MVVKREDPEDEGEEPARHARVHAAGARAFVLLGQDDFQPHGREPVQQPLQERDFDRQIFEFVVVAQQGEGRRVSDGQLGGLPAVTEQHGARDRPNKDGHYFERKGGKEQETEGLLESSDPLLVVFFGAHVLSRLGECHQNSTSHESRGGTQISCPFPCIKRGGRAVI